MKGTSFTSLLLAACLVAAASCVPIPVQTSAAESVASPGASPAVSQDPSLAQAETAPSLGIELMLVTMQPEQSQTWSTLPLAVHLRLSQPAEVAQPEERYLASGSPSERQQAVAAGLAVQLLDADTAGKVYYLVDAAAGDVSQAAAAGSVVYADAAQLLVALPAAEEVSRLEILLRGGLHVSRLDANRLVLAPAAAPALAGGQQAGPDPEIVALLPQITTGGLYTLVAGLSGEGSVPVGGRQVTFNTRYFLGGQIPDVEAYLFEYYTSLGLPTSYVSWTYGNYKGRNVIADLRGTVHPERLWLVGGHYDSNSNNPYVSAPGADDNATGVAATMLIAATLRGHQFADTIRFVNFSAEEFGEWGSKTYAAALRRAGAQVMGYIDLDMIGYDGNHDRVIELHTNTGASSIALGNAMASANTRYGQGLVPEIKQASASNFSDHSSFWNNGYPAVMAIENFYNDTIPADHNPRYHNTADRINLVDFDYVTRYTRTALAATAEMAQLVHPPSDAQFVTQTVPSQLYAGFNYDVSVTFHNTGGSTWSEAGRYRLGSQAPRDNLTWGRQRVALLPGESIVPGAEKRFDFSIRAPRTPGQYVWQWQMLQEDVAWFGETTRSVTITVVPPPVLGLRVYLPGLAH